MFFYFKHLLKYFNDFFPDLPFSLWMTCGLSLGISSFYIPYQSMIFFIPVLLLYIVLARQEKHHFLQHFKLIGSFFLGLTIITYHNKSFFIPVRNKLKIKASIEDKFYTSDSFWKYKTYLKVTDLFYHNTWKTVTPFLLCLYTQKPCFGLPDDRILCTLNELKIPQDSHLMWYLKREGIEATAFEKDFYHKRLYRPYVSIKRWIFLQKNRISFSLRKKMNRDGFTFFSSLFFGNRQQVQKTLSSYKDSFKQWGIMHYLARSGLHLVLFIFIFQSFLNYLPLSFFIKHMLLLVTVGVYASYTWNSLSFMRALLVFIFYTFAFLFNKPIHGIHALACVCFILLCNNPFHLFFLDFQLSFLLSFALLGIINAQQKKNFILNKILQQKNSFS